MDCELLNVVGFFTIFTILNKDVHKDVCRSVFIFPSSSKDHVVSLDSTKVGRRFWLD